MKKKLVVTNVPVRGFITATVEVEGEVTNKTIAEALRRNPPFFANREIEDSDLDDEGMRGWDFEYEEEG